MCNKIDVSEYNEIIKNKKSHIETYQKKSLHTISPPEKILTTQNQILQSHKSIGHCLGPLITMLVIEPDLTDTEIGDIIGFYKNFLALKQLSDDAHDFEEDLLNGQQTPVVQALVNKLRDDTQPSQEFKVTDHTRNVFAKDILPLIHTVVEDCCTQTTHHLKNIFGSRQIPYFVQKIESFRQEPKTALREIEAIELYQRYYPYLQDSSP